MALFLTPKKSIWSEPLGEIEIHAAFVRIKVTFDYGCMTEQ